MKQAKRLADISFSIAPGTQKESIPSILREAEIVDLMRLPAAELNRRASEIANSYSAEAEAARGTGFNRFAEVDRGTLPNNSEYRKVLEALQRQVQSPGQRPQPA